MTAHSLVERWLYAGLVASTTLCASVWLWSILRIDGVTPLKLSLLTLFAILFAWIAASFWLAALGTWLRWMRIREWRQVPYHSLLCTPAAAGRRTAIIMPVCNESAVEIFARIEAMHESLGAAGGFDFFVLSDSTDPAIWIAEELEWDRLRRAKRNGAPIYYRHRASNEGRKTGNIRDFCENWGARYAYMIVLDADSLMTGDTFCELVRRMEMNPAAALIQVPPVLIGRSSLFARIQQFASSVYGPIFWEGLARLQGPEGNYWGHNAIIRVRAFAQACGLPTLPGKPPLGGEILSHDFVEAALLARAGWQVLMAPDLGGSYEEPPPSLLAHVRRDRRWCEGNLQHIKLIFARGLRAASRLHLMVGVMSYLSAPIWLVMILVSVVQLCCDTPYVAVSYEGKYPVLGTPNAHPLELGLLALMAGLLLYGPKLLSLLVLARDPAGLKAHGGAGKAVQGILWESVFSTLLAPVVMLTHAWYVLNVFVGRSVRWGTQQRRDAPPSLANAARAFWPHTLAGAAGTALAWVYIPGSLPWLLPLLAGLLLAIPLSLATASAGIGRAARRRHLFLVPDESAGVTIAHRARALARERFKTRFYGDELNLPRLAREDPFVRALHRALLADGAPADAA